MKHVPRDKRKGGGLATLMPQQMRVLATSSTELYIRTVIAAEGGQVLHLINMYIPPTPHLPEHDAWQHVLDVLDSILPSEPLLLLVDLNAHFGGDKWRQSPCPLHGKLRCQLPGGTCSRGHLVQASIR